MADVRSWGPVDALRWPDPEWESVWAESVCNQAGPLPSGAQLVDEVRGTDAVSKPQRNLASQANHLYHFLM